MKVTVVRSGGIGGIVLTTVVDTAELDPAATDELESLVSGCGFEDANASAPAGADAFAYELSVERDDGSVRRARFGQGAAPSGAAPLVAWVTEGPHGRRTLGR